MVDEALLSRIESDVRERLADRPHRLAHTLGVAACAARLARSHGLDEACARAAGLLHDWEKASCSGDLVARARELGVEMGVDLELVRPLLHGVVAARVLPARYPGLPACVLRAVERHTTGAADMSGLDMAVYVADAIEPGRPETPAVAAMRAGAETLPLDELWFRALSSSIAYVVEGGRYLYPPTFDVYDALAAGRARGEEGA